jgi:hypothetical protein
VNESNLFKRTQRRNHHVPELSGFESSTTYRAEPCHVKASPRSAVHLDFEIPPYVCWLKDWIGGLDWIPRSMLYRYLIFMSRLLYILPRRSPFILHKNILFNSTNTTMKFSNAVLTCLALATPASAWTSGAASTSVRGFRNVAAVQLHSTPSSISTESAGEAATESFRLKFKEGDKPLSPWHDIALKNADGSYNMVSACVHVCLQFKLVQSKLLIVVQF